MNLTSLYQVTVKKSQNPLTAWAKIKVRLYMLTFLDTPYHIGHHCRSFKHITTTSSPPHHHVFFVPTFQDPRAMTIRSSVPRHHTLLFQCCRSFKCTMTRSSAPRRCVFFCFSTTSPRDTMTMTKSSTCCHRVFFLVPLVGVLRAKTTRSAFSTFKCGIFAFLKEAFLGHIKPKKC